MTQELVLENRIFRIATLAGSITLAILSVNAFLLQLGWLVVIACCVGALLFAGLNIFSRRRLARFSEILLFAVLSLVILDVIWAVNGGSAGPGIFSFFIVLSISTLTLQKKQRLLTLGIILANVAGFFLFESLRPDLIIPYPSATAKYIDHFITFFICLCTIYFIVAYAIDTYRGQRDALEAAYRESNEIRENAQRAYFAIEDSLTPIIASIESQITYVNKAAVQLWGFDSAREMMAVPVLALFAPQAHAKFEEIKDEVFAKSVSRNSRGPLIGRRKDGTEFDLEYALTVVRSASGTPVGITGSWLDVTERNRLEIEKQRIHEQLIHSEKLASIGTLAAGVAHEINNPLTIIRLNNSLLRNSLAKKPYNDSNLVLLDRQDLAIDRCAKIINGLRTYARADSEKVERIDVHRAVNETLALCKDIYQDAGIEFAVQPRARQHYIKGNFGKLQQVIMNILSNAKDALDGAVGARIVVETHDDGEWFVLRVTDNGCGIDSKHLKSIYDPFFTTKPPGKGTGLGLAISNGIIQSFGGTIQAQSTVGKGSTFSIRLPADHAHLIDRTPLFEDVNFRPAG